MKRNNLFGICLVFASVLSGCIEHTEKPVIPFTEDHKAAAIEAIRGAGFNVPSEVGLNEHGYIFARVDMPSAPTASVGAYAEKAVLAMRNAVYVLPGADKNWPYKLSIFGPSPGPDLVIVVGTARFSTYEGTSWKPGGF